MQELIPGFSPFPPEKKVRRETKLFWTFFARCPKVNNFCIYYRPAWRRCMLLKDNKGREGRPIKQVRECPDEYGFKFGPSAYKKMYEPLED